jgi:hypothetical protein
MPYDDSAPWAVERRRLQEEWEPTGEETWRETQRYRDEQAALDPGARDPEAAEAWSRLFYLANTNGWTEVEHHSGQTPGVDARAYELVAETVRYGILGTPVPGTDDLQRVLADVEVVGP